ncbi:MAG TPA: hypothetical protein VKR59_02615 [Terriglobales bacterium]|nr:hypothetical protein [Terriglobales bacterium]
MISAVLLLFTPGFIGAKDGKDDGKEHGEDAGALRSEGKEKIKGRLAAADEKIGEADIRSRSFSGN